MEFLAALIIGIYLFVLVRVLRDDRPRAIPRSHYTTQANSHELWDRVTMGWGV